MTRRGLWLGVALVIVLAAGVGWMLLNRRWQAPAPTASSPPSSPDSAAALPATEPSTDAYTAERRRMVETHI